MRASIAATLLACLPLVAQSSPRKLEPIDLFRLDIMMVMASEAPKGFIDAGRRADGVRGRARSLVRAGGWRRGDGDHARRQRGTVVRPARLGLSGRGVRPRRLPRLLVVAGRQEPSAAEARRGAGQAVHDR